MKNVKIIFFLWGIMAICFTVGCESSTSTDTKKVNTEVKNATTKQHNPQDYIGKYMVQGPRGKIYLDVFQGKDSLYFHGHTVGAGGMQTKGKEMFDVPKHFTKLRFMRNDKNEVDRAVVVTKIGRFNAKKVEPDSIQNIINSARPEIVDYHLQLDSIMLALK